MIRNLQINQAVVIGRTFPAGNTRVELWNHFDNYARNQTPDHVAELPPPRHTEADIIAAAAKLLTEPKPESTP